MTFLASMPPARRRIWEAGMRAGIHDPEARGRVQPVELAAACAIVDPDPVGVSADRATMILAEVAAKHRLRVSDIAGNGHAAPVARARHETVYRLHVEAGLTFEEAGERVNRSSTSAMHGAHGHAARYGLPTPVRGAEL